jgi:hypothetical protein
MNSLTLLPARLRHLVPLGLASCFLLGVGCQAQTGATVLPPMQVPPAQTAAPAPATPPPPPAPRCESLAEGCKADESTRVEISQNGVFCTPPSGWTFEKLPDHARTVEPTGVAEVAFTIADSESEADVVKSVEKLAAQMGLEGIKSDRLKKRLKKPQSTLDGNGGTIELWEITGSVQGGAKPKLKDKGAGTALLALARVATERLVVVLGFVVEPDEQGQAGKIMQSVQSLSVTK